MNLIGTIIFISLIVLSYTMPIIQDDQSPEIITEKTSEAYFQYDTKILSYSFNLSSLIQISNSFYTKLKNYALNTHSPYNFSNTKYQTFRFGTTQNVFFNV